MNKKEMLKQYSGHLGAILFNIGIVGILICLSALASGVFWIVLFLFFVTFAFCSVVLTAGLSLTNAGFRSFLSNTFNLLLNQGVVDFFEVLIRYFPVIASIVGVVLSLSLVFLIFDRKNPKSKNRLIALYVLIALFIVGIIIIVISGTLNKGGVA